MNNILKSAWENSYLIDCVVYISITVMTLCVNNLNFTLKNRKNLMKIFLHPDFKKMNLFRLEEMMQNV